MAAGVAAATPIIDDHFGSPADVAAAPFTVTTTDAGDTDVKTPKRGLPMRPVRCTSNLPPNQDDDGAAAKTPR